MGALSEADKQARFAEMTQIPPQVRRAGVIAFGLGVVTCLRILARTYALHLPLGKGLLYGFLFWFWCVLAGASLYARSRWGFIGLLALSVVPLLGLFTLSVHLLRLALEGALAASWPETLHCTLALAQFGLACGLLRYLLAKQAWKYVWKRT